MIRALILAAALALTGCAQLVLGEPASETLKALATDRASTCLTARAVMYGSLTICRSNADAAIMQTDGATIGIQHQRR